MKILIAAPYIYIEEHKHGSRNRSGLAYMIRGIVDMLADSGADVFVLTQSILTNYLKVGKFTMVQKKPLDMLKGLKKVYLYNSLRAIRYDKITLSQKIKIFIYFLTGGYMESVINKLKPDIVHIHSIGLYTLPFIMACVRTNTKFVVTLHGLISFSEATNSSKLEKRLEREFLNYAKEFKITTTVVSTGIKKRISNWQNSDAEYINIILNSVSLSTNRHTYIEEDDTNAIILCVGSFTESKNHIQVVRAFELLEEKIKERYVLYLVGDGIKREEIEDYIRVKNITNVKCTGFISRERVMRLYDKASLTVMASIDEGFGLPVIEGYSKGVPSVAFADLDAIDDLYSNETMVLVKERTDIALAKGINDALIREWDKNIIIEFSSKFSPSLIGNEYFDVLCKCVQNNIKFKDLEKMINKIYINY